MLYLFVGYDGTVYTRTEMPDTELLDRIYTGTDDLQFKIEIIESEIIVSEYEDGIWNEVPSV